MSKYNYVKRQIAKTNKKNDENYIVTRIWHLLGNYDIKMNTQQYVVRKNKDGKIVYALVDLFFPQFNIAIEIDESYHKNELIQKLDEIRKNDIINALNGCDFIRIDATQTIEKIHEDIEVIVQKINLLTHDDSFTPWDMERDYDPNTYIEQGYIDADDHISLLRVFECCNVFGSGYKGFQGSGAIHKFEKDVEIKRLKFYPNNAWNNELLENEEVFTEYNTDKNINEEYYQDRMYNDKYRKKTALFTYAKTSSGAFEATFKGLYELNSEVSLEKGRLTYNRISKLMPTYYPVDVGTSQIIAEAYDYNKNPYKVAHFYTEEQIKKFRIKYKDKYKIVKV